LAALESVGLGHLAHHDAHALSLGTRRLIEVARALCGDPRLLLLDEPASGLSEQETRRLGTVIREAAGRGTTVVLIEHNFRFVTEIADVAHVLHFGELIATGPAATIGANDRVIESYLGSSVANRTATRQGAVEVRVSGAGRGLDTPESHGRDRPRAEARPLLQLCDAVTGYGDLRVLRGLSLELREGCVEVVLGRNGVGKTTTLAAISGQLPLWDGTLLFDGVDVTRRASFQRAAGGIAFVQQGKRIFRRRTVVENLLLGTYSLRISRREREGICDELLERFPALRAKAHESAGRLSGGQQQMLAIAQALASRPRVLLLDEPSAGLAPVVLAEVFDQVKALRDQGMAVALVEQLAEDALAVADHVTVLNNGVVVTSGPPTAFHDLRELQEVYLGGGAAVEPVLPGRQNPIVAR
jgi:branched-chain amino acid transport system ATP-binding protein